MKKALLQAGEGVATSGLQPEGLKVNEVLMHFATEQGMPMAGQLSRYVAQFPQFEQELIELAVWLIIDEISGAPPDAGSTADNNKA